MEDRFIVTQYGTYGEAGWTGVNTSGFRALCDKVIVLPDQASEQTQGGVRLAEQTVENQSFAATSGVLVSCGPQAFAYDSQRMVTWVGERPQPGDRVRFVKYAGELHQGADGEMYRIMEDRSIAAVEEPITVETVQRAAE